MMFDEILKVLDVMTLVEVVKASSVNDKIVYTGRLKDIDSIKMLDYKVYKVMPCSTSRETYLQIDVY